MGKIQVLFYDAPDGTEPAKEFMLSLDVKMRAKMARAVMMLETNGGELREPTSKPLGDGIYELRAQMGNNISRVLYFFFVGNKAILTNGFIKKTQKTPRREIDRAKRYRAEFLSREENQG
ncbi:MAG: type II toxin-antitoxin system RelE/ParE family toxin [Clostridiales bacterium]|nr:type II toxin-antitoxin system RelE/ParE family toxin [Clostridiales bacterium]